MDDLLDYLGIDGSFDIQQSLSTCSVDLKTDSNFSKVFSKLSEGDFEEDETKAILNADEAFYLFYNEEYEISIDADLAENKYQLHIKEL